MASTTHMTSKPKRISGQNKSQSNAAISSQDEVALPLPLPVNGFASVSDDANQGRVPSDGESNLGILKQRREVSEQDNLPNIDDDCNHLEVPEYVDDIYQYYWVTEAQNPALANYMSNQKEITPYMRGFLINWLIEVHMKFDLMRETLYLTVTLLDQYLSMVKDLVSILAESYTRDQMLEMDSGDLHYNIC
ncbi:hypothetical protein PIB30_068359 [Stylosanthes scabra]|uniref:B-like cyclin n=1 Tax=Stylosanthes scabra TaxID=79078 RepID=A0ABU6WMH3_9FABA|nr:hypothetical protein [Stylosanthes scabra]